MSAPFYRRTNHQWVQVVDSSDRVIAMAGAQCWSLIPLLGRRRRPAALPNSQSPRAPARGDPANGSTYPKGTADLGTNELLAQTP
jgi:hypothetical protein